MFKKLLELHKAHCNRNCEEFSLPLYMEIFPSCVVVYTTDEWNSMESMSCISKEELPSDISEEIASFGEEETFLVWEESGAVYLSQIKNYLLLSFIHLYVLEVVIIKNLDNMRQISSIGVNTNSVAVNNWLSANTDNQLHMVVKAGIPAFYGSDRYCVHTINDNYVLYDNKIEYINLTPHDIHLNNGVVYPASGTIARISNTFSSFNKDGVCQMRYGDPTGLPEPQEGVLLIVSLPLLMALPDRWDLVAPATGHPDCVRENGFIKSVPGFVSLQ